MVCEPSRSIGVSWVLWAGAARAPDRFAVKTKRPAGFLNVDLQIESSSSLKSLVTALGSAVYPLYCGKIKGKHFLSVEISAEFHTPDEVAMALCRAVERLAPRGREKWNQAERREFNVGYDLLAGVFSVGVSLLPETVRRITALGATVGFTCYRGEEDDPRVGGGARQSVRSKTAPNAATRPGRRSRRRPRKPNSR
jgi:hypothetical protein